MTKSFRFVERKLGLLSLENIFKLLLLLTAIKSASTVNKPATKEGSSVLDQCLKYGKRSSGQELFLAKRSYVHSRILHAAVGCVNQAALSSTEGHTYLIHLTYQNNLVAVPVVRLKIFASTYQGPITLILSSRSVMKWDVFLEDLPTPPPGHKKHRIILGDGSTIFYEQWRASDKVTLSRMPVLNTTFEGSSQASAIRRFRDLFMEHVGELVTEPLTSMMVFNKNFTNEVNLYIKQASPPSNNSSISSECEPVFGKTFDALYEGFLDIDYDTKYISGCTVTPPDPTSLSEDPRPIHWLNFGELKHFVLLEPYMRHLEGEEAADEPLLVIGGASRGSGHPNYQIILDVRRLRRKIIVETNHQIILTPNEDKTKTSLVHINWRRNVSSIQLSALVKQIYLLHKSRAQYTLERLNFPNPSRNIKLNYILLRMDARPTILNDLKQQLTVDCTRNSMTVRLPRHVISQDADIDLTIGGDSHCRLESNETHLFKSIVLHPVQCSSSPKQIINSKAAGQLQHYIENVVILKDKKSGQQYPLKVSCPWFSEPFPPPTVTFKSSIEFKLFPDKSFRNSFNGRRSVEPESTIYAHITSLEKATNILLQDCFISSSAKGSLDNESRAKTMFLIRKGCKAKNSSSDFHWLSNTKEQQREYRFSFVPPWSFVSLLPKPYFHLHCFVIKCKGSGDIHCVANQNALCSLQTRSEPTSLISKHLQVNQRPLTTKPNIISQSTPGLTFPAVFGIACAAFLLGVLSSLALWIIHRRIHPAKHRQHQHHHRTRRSLHHHIDACSPRIPLHIASKAGPPQPPECSCLECSSGSTPCSQKPLCNPR